MFLNSLIERYLVIMIVLAVATLLWCCVSKWTIGTLPAFPYSLTPYNSIMFIVILGIYAFWKKKKNNVI